MFKILWKRKVIEAFLLKLERLLYFSFQDKIVQKQSKWLAIKSAECNVLVISNKQGVQK
ncbi:unnamed protein product [Paramecium pentaurelia]|uniref:Uncharacterized protein n=1 Tax=Paramecium pentaurelia TaxID=43138 RepID=A0A8S1Y0V5_9CILI|nr:unnamed protein product [Paramecium pentaurelia]